MSSLSAVSAYRLVCAISRPVAQLEAVTTQHSITAFPGGVSAMLRMLKKLPFFATTTTSGGIGTVGKTVTYLQTVIATFVRNNRGLPDRES